MKKKEYVYTHAIIASTVAAAATAHHNCASTVSNDNTDSDGKRVCSKTNDEKIKRFVGKSKNRNKNVHGKTNEKSKLSQLHQGPHGCFTYISKAIET